MTPTNTPDPTPDSAELNKKTSVDASLHSLRLNTPILPQVRQLLLDLLSEYQSLDKPANPELLKLHIEAYEDKLLALIRTEKKKLLAAVMERKREYTRDGAPGGIAEAVPVAIIEQKIKSLEEES